MIEYRKAFADGLIGLAQAHDNVILIESDIESPAREWFIESRPDHFVNTGVAEANAAGIAAGLSAEGYVPFWYTYGFLIERAYNQIKQSIMTDQRNVKIVAYNCGVSGIGGSSHNEVFDLAFMRVLPGFTILTPSFDVELAKMVHDAFWHTGPVYIRFPRGPAYSTMPGQKSSDFGIGQILFLNDLLGERTDEEPYLTVFLCGSMIDVAPELWERLGKNVQYILVNTLKPLPAEVLDHALRTNLMVTIEEHSIIGGLGDAIAEAIMPYHAFRIKKFGVHDVKTQSGKGDLRKHYGLTAEIIAGQIQEWINER